MVLQCFGSAQPRVVSGRRHLAEDIRRRKNPETLHLTYVVMFQFDSATQISVDFVNICEYLSVIIAGVGYLVEIETTFRRHFGRSKDLLSFRRGR